MATTVHEPPQIDSRRLPEPKHSGNGGWRNLVPADGDLRAGEGLLAPAVFDRHLGGAVRHHDDVRRFHQRPGRSQRLVAGLATIHLAIHPLLQHPAAHRQQRHSGSLASPCRSFHGRFKKRSREPGTLAVHHFVSRPAFCGGSVRRLAATERARCFIWPPIPAVRSSMCSPLRMRCTCWEGWAG